MPGHGTHPYAGYAETADQLVTFAGPWTDYRWSQGAPWTAAHPASRSCHLVHGVPRTRLEAALPGYWDEIVSRIGPGVSE